MTRLTRRGRRCLAVAGLAAMFGLGFVAHNPDSTLRTCPGPALPGHHAAPMRPGEAIHGTDGRNAVAPGDTYTCTRHGVKVS